MPGRGLRMFYSCAGSSRRSQMAGVVANALGGRKSKRPSPVTLECVGPRRLRVMDDTAIDIWGQSSKDAGEIWGKDPGLVAALGDRARDFGPFFGKSKKVA